jgi:integrase/recombinase XerD
MNQPPDNGARTLDALREISGLHRENNPVTVSPDLGSVNAMGLSPSVTDERVVSMWLVRFDSPNTRRAYARDAASMLSFVGKPIDKITYPDVDDWMSSLTGSAASRRRQLCAIRSLFAFAMRIGYLRFNPSAPIRLPKVPATLSGRILDETDVIRMLALEDHPRNRALLHVLYYGAMRLAEALSLCWADIISRDGGRAQINVIGKGRKSRAVLLPARTYRMLQAIEGCAEPEDPVFRTRNGRLSEAQARRIVRAASSRCGISQAVSPHWLRHAHASHAHQRGCPLAVISETLGHANLSTTSTYVHARPDSSSALWLDGSTRQEPAG